MQRMDVAKIRNGKRTTDGRGATHTEGRTKADHHTEGRTKRTAGGRRGTHTEGHTGNNQTIITCAAFDGDLVCCALPAVPLL